MKTPMFAATTDNQNSQWPVKEVPYLARRFAQNRWKRFSRSMRVPTIPENRNLLRAMRAEELAAWNKTGAAV